MVLALMMPMAEMASTVLASCPATTSKGILKDLLDGIAQATLAGVAIAVMDAAVALRKERLFIMV